MATRRLAVGITSCLVIAATLPSGLAAPPPGSGFAVGPAGAQRKLLPTKLPDGVTAEVIDDWVDAIIYDDEGDLELSAREWGHITSRLPKLALAHYNLADVYRRYEKLERAVEEYRKYLELKPKASDRAAVTKLADQIGALSTLTIGGKEPGAVVYFDGKLLGMSPVTRTLTAGVHTVDRVGPRSYAHHDVRATPGHHQDASGGRVPDSDEDVGNVIISSSSGFGSGSWTDEKTEYQMERRFTLAAGHYSTKGYRNTCTPIVFDVKPAPAVTFVFIAASHAESGTCTPIKVTAQTVPLAGPL